MESDSKIIFLPKAVALCLGETDKPVMTGYSLGKIIFHFLKNPIYRGQPIHLPEGSFDYFRAAGNLMDNGILEPYESIPHTFAILGKKADSPEDVACAIDPFAYVSHLSAMLVHGLTDRIPGVLFISSPPPKAWTKFALERMKKDLGEDGLAAYREAQFPLLTRIRFDKIGRTPVQRHESIHLGAFKSFKHRALRVSTIGRTFLDMLRRPDLCGGIHHVLDVYREHARAYVGLIVDDIDRHGTGIDKVRAGYVLEEVCGLGPDDDERIGKWREKYVQRGGSRKLDPTGEYAPEYSEKWCLSINI